MLASGVVAIVDDNIEDISSTSDRVAVDVGNDKESLTWLVLILVVLFNFNLGFNLDNDAPVMFWMMLLIPLTIIQKMMLM